MYCFDALGWRATVYFIEQPAVADQLRDALAALA
jgi:hypothetical protein